MTRRPLSVLVLISFSVFVSALSSRAAKGMPGGIASDGSSQGTESQSHGGIQYVAVGGADGNNGLSRSTAKASIRAAYAALPSCHSGRNWAHCGAIRLGAGTYTISSPLVVDSPQVSIRGEGQGVTILRYTGTSGCAIEWTGYNAGSGFRAGELRNFAIDGAGAGPGTCGLKTYDIVAVSIHNVTILNFSGAGSMGWDDTVQNQFNERYNVDLTLQNDTTGWMLEGGAGRPGYPYPGTTFGYGILNMWINTSASGQVGIHADNHALIQFSNLHIIENMVSGTTALDLTNHSLIEDCLVDFHFEGGSTGIRTDPTSAIRVIGPVSETPPMTDSFGGRYPQNYVFGYTSGPCPTGSQCFLSLVPYQGANANFPFTLGAATDVGHSAELAIGLPPGSSNWPFAIGEDGKLKLGVDTTGEIRVASGYLISAGTIRLNSGSGSHTFATAYSQAPVCVATDTTHAAPVKVTNDARTVHVSGTGDDVISWVCTPGDN